MSTGYVLLDLSVLPAFLGAVVVILLAPGPDMAYMIASGLGGGRRAATRAALGITAGVSVYVVLTALGLGALLTALPGAVDVIRLAGAGYLAYLAWTALHGSGAPLPTQDSPTRVFRRGFLVNLANPKIMLFFTAFLPQFLGDAAAHPVAQLLLLGLLLQSLGLLVDLAVGYAAGAVRDRLRRTRVRLVFERLSAVVYGVLSGLLVVDVATDHLVEPAT